jgi:hypothetical protein
MSFDTVRAVLILTGFGLALSFIIYYWITSPWERSDVGRHMMFMGFTVASLFASGIVARYVTNQVAEDVLRTILLALAVTFTMRTLIVFHRVRTRGRRRDKSADYAEDRP